MNLPPQRLLDALLRNDFLSFALRVFREIRPGQPFEIGWVHEALAEYCTMMAVERQFQRLIVNVPPRSAKSTFAAVALPAYLLGRDPRTRIIVVSYSQELANFFGRQTRQVMQSDWYKRLFLSTRIPTRAAEAMIYTTAGGYRLATSTGGMLTGRGGDVIIVDDPLKADDALSKAARDSLLEWAMNTLFPRLDDKLRGAILLVQQRQHEDDMSGHMLRAGGWLHLNVPAIALKEEQILLSRSPLRLHHRRIGDLLDPVREPKVVLDGLRQQMGTSAFAAQYQQDPLPPDGDVIKLHWFKTFDEVPDEGQTVLSIDTASKGGLRNDWSVIQVWRMVAGRFYLLQAWRRQVDYPELRHSVIEHARRLRPDVILIEDKGSGIGLIQDLRADSEGFPVIAWNPGHFDKETRMRVHSAKIEAGVVWLPPEAPWLEEFLNEVRRFPNGTHDDQIDAMSQLLEYFDQPASPWPADRPRHRLKAGQATPRWR